MDDFKAENVVSFNSPKTRKVPKGMLEIVAGAAICQKAVLKEGDTKEVAQEDEVFFYQGCKAKVVVKTT